VLLRELLEELLEKYSNLHVVIETSGYVPLSGWMDHIAKRIHNHVHFCVDYKLPSSGMEHRMVEASFFPLRPSDSIKYVVADEEDFSVAVDHLCRVRDNYGLRATALFSPVWSADNTRWLRRLADLIQGLPDELSPFRLSLQQHKITHEPATRKV